MRTRRNRFPIRPELPATPRMLTPDEILILEPEDQLRYLRHEMKRSVPENPVINSTLLMRM